MVRALGLLLAKTGSKPDSKSLAKYVHGRCLKLVITSKMARESHILSVFALLCSVDPRAIVASRNDLKAARRGQGGVNKEYPLVTCPGSRV